MLNKFALGLAAATTLAFAAPAYAQDEPEEPRTTYRIELIKLKPGAAQRWSEMGEKYFGPATDAAGLDRPEVHWIMAGPWDLMLLFKMPRGLAALDSHNPPERTAFRQAFIKIAGSDDAAKKLWEEGDSLVANSMVTYSHTHP